MKEFDPIPNLPDKTSIVNQKQVDYEKKFLGTTRRYNGHTMYEINCSTGEMLEAKYTNERVELVPRYDLNYGGVSGTSSVVKKDIVVNENCIYIAALNKKSAQKKFLKYLIENGKPKIP